MKSDLSGDLAVVNKRVREQAQQEEINLTNRIAKGDATALFDAIMHFWAASVGKR